jgi:hypothetical protein
LKPKDQYQVAKSKALVDPQSQQNVVPQNTITADKQDATVANQPDQSKQPGTTQPKA